MAIDGKTLIDWGYAPGRWFPAAVAAANAAAAEGAEEPALRAIVQAHAPAPAIPLRDRGALPFARFLEAETEAEAANLAAVEATMAELMRVPTIRAGAVMPDACPAGGVGTIPVGGAVACENAVHPGFHSADICCSVAISVLGDVDPKKALDIAQARTHFGGGGRGEARLPAPALLAEFADNPFLSGLEEFAHDHFGTQGDGNHFLFVGRMGSTGETAIVTHHGSRKPGAMLYKRGMLAAERHTRAVSPETPKGSAWIEAESEDGRAYWAALQLMRAWTKASHEAIHDLVCAGLRIRPKDRFWNEHNFVFRRSDGLFLHGKGATPAWKDYAADASGLTLIPLNMAEPVLIARGADKSAALGFAPHGAGRNWGRGAHLRRLEGVPPREVLKRETKGLDIRFYAGVPDLSELPSAYKSAAAVRRQIDGFGLAEVVDLVEPYGSIMAGDWQAPFRAARREKQKDRDRTRDRERKSARGRKGRL